ncbi:glutathione S-transferase [Uliginosibacterium sp. H3]|uniref:Glutathione S-transferase n=1 Tax=Uliginosibacterium silvisoli TaxID=3114758 RepID=A0ABU6JZP2_9RHOO|nr:glutathione S-transferase [Uliginosibacterium sp. H3]
MSLPSAPIRLHRFARSGHCHRVELFLSLLGLPYEAIDVDLPGKAQKTSAFLAMNPFGQVPVIEDGALALADSNAILVYLAAQYGGARWQPQSPVAAAEQQRWLSVAAGLLAFGPAAARANLLFGAPNDLAAVQARAKALFAVMEAHLAQQAFLTGDAVGLADVANYAYVARAPEGGLPLADYPHIRAWLARIEALPGFVPMPVSAQS